MNFRAPFIALALVATASAQAPKIFSGLFEKDTPVKGQIGIVIPPQEIDKYVAKVEKAARQDPKWFREFSAQAKPGAPLPWNEKLGLTKEEYDAYLKLWSQREFKPMEDVLLQLRENTQARGLSAPPVVPALSPPSATSPRKISSTPRTGL